MPLVFPNRLFHLYFNYLKTLIYSLLRKHGSFPQIGIQLPGLNITRMVCLLALTTPTVVLLDWPFWLTRIAIYLSTTYPTTILYWLSIPYQSFFPQKY